MQSLKDEINTDIFAIKTDMNTNMHSLIDPIRASMDLLLEMKSTWEMGLKKCQSMHSEKRRIKNEDRKSGG